jgi:hypothetical protein
MVNLTELKERIEKLSKFHQIEILRLLKTSGTCTLNENKNGVFVNLTNINKHLILELVSYLEYVQKQEKQLNDIEIQKDVLSNTFFKDNKDTSTLSLNA